MNTGWLSLFDLRKDQQDTVVIDEAMRSGAQFAGTPLWVLIFAILIASVGLNTNSTAVIIGAMLISPLMGPIVGIGYGAAIHDLALIRVAAKNLTVFVVLSLVTSVLYFTLSPLDEPRSELLARTSPSLWDVLIALFGGAAGMIAVTRKVFSNIVPGVAIATALMPPLCTAGFGIAHGRWDMFGGAFYLFLINGVFIAASTLAVARVLRLPRVGWVDPAAQLRTRVLIGLGLALVFAPSIWLAYRLVQHEVFASGAARAGRVIEAEPGSNVLLHDIDVDAREVRLTLIGHSDEARVRARMDELLRRERVTGARVVLRMTGDAPFDVDGLRHELRDGANQALAQQVESIDARIKALQTRLDAEPAATPLPDARALRDEVLAQLPGVHALSFVTGTRASVGGDAAPTVVVVLDVPRPLSASERTRLTRWLAVRVNAPDLQLVERVTPDGRTRSSRS